MKLSDKLFLGLFHHYTLLTGKTVEYGYHSLMPMQTLTAFGTPAVDEYEHIRNQNEKVWHPLFAGFDGGVERPNPHFDNIRDAFTLNKSSEQSAEYKDSLIIRTDMQAFFKEAGVIAQDEAAHLLWEDYTVGYKLDIATGLRTDKPWAAPGPVKNPYTTP